MLFCIMYLSTSHRRCVIDGNKVVVWAAIERTTIPSKVIRFWEDRSKDVRFYNLGEFRNESSVYEIDPALASFVPAISGGQFIGTLNRDRVLSRWTKLVFDYRHASECAETVASLVQERDRRLRSSYSGILTVHFRNRSEAIYARMLLADKEYNADLCDW